MREAAFIKANRDKWEEIDNETQSEEISADVLADNFIELTDDLSYARTFYPKSKTVKYLNQLAGHYFIDIYQYRKKEKGRFIRFWVEELPTIMYRHKKYMLFAFIFFFTGIVLGIFSQSQNNEFANYILGDSYVNMTLDNIERGDPMAVYKDENKSGMFFSITTNNIKVAFYAFILGIMGSILTVFLLFYNGIIVGVFQYFFFEKGLLTDAVLAMFLHGTLEISAIIIAGGAGILLGNSLLFPGSYRRVDSLMRAAKDALKIVVGLIPVFIVAGFIESYLTRLTEMHAIFHLSVIGTSAIFIAWYFFYYPFLVNKKLNRKNEINYADVEAYEADVI